MKKLIPWFIVVAAFIAASTSVFIIDETEVAIVTQFGQHKKSIMSPGLNYKLPWQDVTRMDRRVLSSNSPSARMLTKDKKYLVADPVTRWQIQDPLLFFKSVRNEAQAKHRIDDIVLSELRRELGTANFGDIIGNEREPIVAKVATAARTRVREFGIDIIDVRIRRADLPQEVQKSVFDRMKAERERVAKKYRSEGEEEAQKIRADTDKEKRILLAKAYETEQKLKGEGDAESIRIYAEAFGKDEEFYNFVRSLEAYEASIKKDDTLVLSSKSELFRYLKSRK
ncbi:MAG: protease modulator HflC [Polyangiaceae bacterium]|nr:protease modulator HflC [Polyangiaceae bacterium]MCW5792649.1 protease modulator HflC [Polyangiaceae bacterium]